MSIVTIVQEFYYFSDGTRWAMGHFEKADPNRPGSSITITRDEWSSYAEVRTERSSKGKRGVRTCDFLKQRVSFCFVFWRRSYGSARQSFTHRSAAWSATIYINKAQECCDDYAGNINCATNTDCLQYPGDYTGDGNETVQLRTVDCQLLAGIRAVLARTLQTSM